MTTDERQAWQDFTNNGMVLPENHDNGTVSGNPGMMMKKLAKTWLYFLMGLTILVFVAIAVFLIGFLIYGTIQGEPGVWPIDVAFVLLILTALSLWALGEL